MANGRVITGYSLPWVALYANSSGTITYSGGIPLARGVSVAFNISGGGNDFYADNVMAEAGAGTFTGGTVTLTVDGMKDAARKLISGQTATKSYGSQNAVTFDSSDDTAAAPYVGIGFVVRYQEAGEVSYDAVVLTKARFNVEGLDAKTQEENVEYQTASLEAKLMRDDSSAHIWKLIKTGCETEAEAVAAYKAVLTPAA